jgi:hypothetical protein
MRLSVAVGSTTAPELANVASTMINSIAAPQHTFQGWAPGAWAQGAWKLTCGTCGKALPSGAAFCAFCGRPVAPNG